MRKLPRKQLKSASENSASVVRTSFVAPNISLLDAGTENNGDTPHDVANS